MNFSEKGSGLAQRETSRKNNELTDHKNTHKKQTLCDHMEGVRKETQEYEDDTITSDMLHRDDSHHGEKDTERDLTRKPTLLNELPDFPVQNDIDESQASHDEHSNKATDDKNLETVFDVKEIGYSSKKMKEIKDLKDCSFVKELECNKDSDQYLNQSCVVSNRGPYKKPHKCDRCETSFRTPYELERHGRIHSGERPFKCQLCDMCFKRKDHVEVHMRRHIEDRRHVCDLCGMWFVTSSCLLRHRRRTHQVFDPPSQIKHGHWPRKIPVKYSGGAGWGEPEEILSFSPSYSVPLEEQQRKCKKSKRKIKQDSTYRPGSKTVCILKKRKLRNKSYSFVELDDDIECFESDEEDRIPCLKIQGRGQAVKQEDEEMITEVLGIEHSLFPNSFLSYGTSLDQLFPVREVSKLISERYIADLREDQLEVSCVSVSTKKDENSTKLQTEESNFSSEDEESEMPMISCDVSFDEPENESLFSTNDIDSEKTSSSVDVLDIEGNQNDSMMEAFSEPLKRNIPLENDSSEILPKVDFGPSTDSCKTDKSKQIKKEREEYEEENDEQYNQIQKGIHHSARERSQTDSSNVNEDLNNTPGLSENHPISHQSYSAIASSRHVWQNALLRSKNSKGISSPIVQIVKEDPEERGIGYKKSHKCHLCDLYFRSPSELERHDRIHSGERPYLCELCGSGFIRKCHLQLHMRRHTGERRHTCRECGMMFFTTSDLNRHMLIHITNKPFKCHICTLTFRRISHLEQHVRRHIDVTPFTCKLCETFFTSAASLKKHEKHHFGKDPYSCPECNASFSTSTSLSKHRHVHIDPQFSLLKTSKFHFEGVKKNDQYECVSSKGSPLSLVIRRVSASERLESVDADIDDTTQQTMSGWKSKDSFCRNQSLLSCKDLSFVKDKARNMGVLYSIRQDISYKNNNVFHENGNQMVGGGYAYVLEENSIRDFFKLHLKDQKPLDSRRDDTLILDDVKKQNMSKISKPGKICSMVKDIQSQDVQVWKYDSKNGSFTDKVHELISKAISLNLFPVFSKDLSLLNSCLQQDLRGGANIFLSNLGKILILAKDNFHLLDNLDERYIGENRNLLNVDVKYSEEIIRKKPALLISKEVGADKVHLDPLGGLKGNINSKKTINSYKAIEKVDELENNDIPPSSVSQEIRALVVAVCNKEYLSTRDEVHQSVTGSYSSPDQTKNASDSHCASHVESKTVNQDVINIVSGKILDQALCVQSIKNRYLDFSKLKINFDNENSVSVHEYSPLLTEASTTLSELGHKSKMSTGLQEDSENIELFDHAVVPTCSLLPCASRKPTHLEPVSISVFSDIKQEGNIPKPNPMKAVTFDMRQDGIGEDSAVTCIAVLQEKQEDVKPELGPPCSVSFDEQKGIVKQNPTTRGLLSVDKGQGARPIQTVLSSVLSHENQEKFQSETRHLSFLPSDKQQEEIKSHPLYKDQKCDNPVTMCPVLSDRIKGNHKSEITSKKQKCVMADPSAEKQKGQKQMEVDPVLIGKNVRQDPVLTDPLPLHTGQEKDERDGLSSPDCKSNRITSLGMDKVYSEGSLIPYPQRAHQEAKVETNGERCRNITGSLKFQISNILS